MIADVASLEDHRPALTGHCYRMLGSVFDADDAVQETMLRAWKAWSQFDGRSSIRTWLYRIATNVCLDELKDRGRRAIPVEEGAPGAPSIENLAQQPNSFWIEPMLDAGITPAGADPAEQLMLRQSIRLAFMAALQHLAPKQRAALLLTEVLGFSAGEAASTLDVSVASVNSALQRARSALEKRDSGASPELSAAQQDLVTRYISAFESYDVDRLTTLMRQDATICMPPYSLWLQGHDDIRSWMLGPGSPCRGSRLIPTSACGSPAFAQYRPEPEGGHKPWALIVLNLAGDQICGTTSFLDADSLFRRFGFPLTLAS
ncbi:MAG TPA: sigma-70 family RNA polymerase sigma factor [Bryobacteraceae bacterium]|nr:sigma-70 family RNA polymerase sigma factor [Bryobacteraceae bacterium]